MSDSPDMKVRHDTLHVMIVGVSLACAIPLNAQFSNGQDAAQVIGQPDFDSNLFHAPADGFNVPRGVAVDPQTGKLFVVDFGNDRVLRYANVDSLPAGAPPEAVFGQPDLSTTGPGLSATELDTPYGASIDANGNLWVADSGNARVVRFANAATSGSGSAAVQVLGQPDLNTGTPDASQSGMLGPSSAVVTDDGTAWVCDRGANRLLRFDNVLAAGNGPNADGVLGQLNFTSFFSATDQTGLNIPQILDVDTAGNLFVADQQNRRVISHVNAALKPNGAEADGVLGQTDFVSSSGDVQKNRFASPNGVATGPFDLLAVADGSGRVLLFKNAAELNFGAAALTVLGKNFFATDTPSTPSQNNLGNQVIDVCFDPAGRLYAVDVPNHRILRFDPDELANNCFQSSITPVNRGTRAIFPIENSGAFAADFSIQSKLKVKGGRARVKIIYNGKNIRSMSSNGTATTGILPPGENARIVVRARAKKGFDNVKLRAKISARSLAYPEKSASAVARVQL